MCVCACVCALHTIWWQWLCYSGPVDENKPVVYKSWPLLSMVTRHEVVRSKCTPHDTETRTFPVTLLIHVPQDNQVKPQAAMETLTLMLGLEEWSECCVMLWIFCGARRHREDWREVFNHALCGSGLLNRRPLFPVSLIVWLITASSGNWHHFLITGTGRENEDSTPDGHNVSSVNVGATHCNENEGFFFVEALTFWRLSARSLCWKAPAEFCRKKVSFSLTKRGGGLSHVATQVTKN